MSRSELELDREIGDLDWTVFPPQTVADRFEAPSGPLARVRLGPEDGERVLLAPGATGSKEDFVLMMPILAAAGYRVESFDLAGQYESAEAGPERLVPPRQRYDWDLFTGDLEAVLDDGDGPAHVLGYSFAGLVAQQVLASRPELFRSLALLTSPPETGQAFRAVKWLGPASSLTSAKVTSALMVWGIRNNLNRVPPGRLAFVRERFELTRRESVTDMVALMMEVPDVRAQVRRSPIPKLVAIGQHDLWPAEEYRRYAEEIDAELVEYDTGHSPCETVPHQLCRDLLALYARAGE